MRRSLCTCVCMCACVCMCVCVCLCVAGMQVVVLDDVTLSVGGLLCNDTHIIKAFALHGAFQAEHAPGCFGHDVHRVVHIGGAIVVPTRWGNSWQHFIQDAVWEGCTASHCTTLHHTAPHCTTLHHNAPHCTTLQHTAPHCNTL